MKFLSTVSCVYYPSVQVTFINNFYNFLTQTLSFIKAVQKYLDFYPKLWSEKAVSSLSSHLPIFSAISSSGNWIWSYLCHTFDIIKVWKLPPTVLWRACFFYKSDFLVPMKDFNLSSHYFFPCCFDGFIICCTRCSILFICSLFMYASPKTEIVMSITLPV